MFEELKHELKRVWNDKKGVGGTDKIAAVVGLVVVFIFWLYITPVVAYQIDYIVFHNASDWNFTAHEGAAAILGLGGFVWVAGGLILLVGGIFSIMKWGGN